MPVRQRIGMQKQTLTNIETDPYIAELKIRATFHFNVNLKLNRTDFHRVGIEELLAKL